MENGANWCQTSVYLGIFAHFAKLESLKEQAREQSLQERICGAALLLLV